MIAVALAIVLVAGMSCFCSFRLGRIYERREVLRYFAMARAFLASGVANLVYRRVEGEFTDEGFHDALVREHMRRSDTLEKQ